MDTTTYYITRASAYYYADDLESARAYADSALRFMQAKEYDKTDNPVIMSQYAATLAMLPGRRQEALKLIDRAVEKLPIEKDALSGSDIRNTRMIIYILTEDYDAAIREIEFLLSVPSTLTPAVLRVHPGFDPLRDDPRFKRLTEAKVSL
jgi:serine/threonine-protein kinase